MFRSLVRLVKSKVKSEWLVRVVYKKFIVEWSLSDMLVV